MCEFSSFHVEKMNFSREIFFLFLEGGGEITMVRREEGVLRLRMWGVFF